MAALVALSIAPAVALLAFIYLSDLYEREPLRVVGATYLKGMALVPVAALIESKLASVLPADITVESFIVVALTEEMIKFLGSLVWIYRNSQVDEEMDTVVYCSSLSLGFATAENLLYVLTRGAGSGLMRAVLPVPGHAFFAVAMGFYLGKARFGNGARRADLMAKALFVPVCLHGAYNYFLTSSISLAVLVVPLMAYLWWNALKKMREAESGSPFRKRTFARKST